MLNLPDIDDDIAVGELGNGLRNDSLATTKSAGNTDSATLNTGEKRVQDSLADDKRRVRTELVVDRSGYTDRPLVHHAELGLLSIKLDLENLLINGVAASLGNPGDGTACSGGKKNFVLVEKRVLPDDTEDITASDVVADLVLGRLEIPLLGSVKGWNIDTTRNVDAVGDVGDTLQRALNTVVDGFHETRAKFNGQRLASSSDRITDGDTSYTTHQRYSSISGYTIILTSLLVYLDGGLVSRDANNLTNQLVMSDFDLLLSVRAYDLW